MTDNGGPPKRVLVKMSWGTAVARAQGRADNQGRFYFRPGDDSTSQILDASAATSSIVGELASANGNLRFFDRVGCTLFADLRGYRSDRLPLRADEFVASYDVGQIVLHRTMETDSATSLSAPRKAMRAYRKGVGAIRAKRPDISRGIAQLASAVKAYPRFAAAWEALGNARLAIYDLDAARRGLNRSIEAAPDFTRPYGRLIEIAAERADRQAVESHAETLLSESPNSPRSECGCVLVAIRLGEFDRLEGIGVDLPLGREAKRHVVCAAAIEMLHESWSGSSLVRPSERP